MFDCDQAIIVAFSQSMKAIFCFKLALPSFTINFNDCSYISHLSVTVSQYQSHWGIRKSKLASVFKDCSWVPSLWAPSWLPCHRRFFLLKLCICMLMPQSREQNEHVHWRRGPQWEAVGVAVTSLSFPARTMGRKQNVKEFYVRVHHLTIPFLKYTWWSGR